jgi:hypothetical protein
MIFLSLEGFLRAVEHLESDHISEEEPSTREFDKICSNTPWIDDLCQKTLESQSLDTAALADKPPIEIAAFFHNLVDPGLYFRHFAQNVSARDLSKILIELLIHNLHTFMYLLDQLPGNRIGAVIDEIKLQDRDNFYPRILEALGHNCFPVETLRRILINCTPEMRRSILVETVWNNRFMGMFDLLQDYDDLYCIFNELLSCHLNRGTRPIYLAMCLEKMLPQWLEKRPFEENSPDAEIFYRIDSATFGFAIERIAENKLFTREMRSEFLHALDWDRTPAKNTKIDSITVESIGSLLSLAGSAEDIEKFMAWADIENRFYTDIGRFNFVVSECYKRKLDTLLACTIFHLPQNKSDFMPKDDHLLFILYTISMVPDLQLLPLVDQCSHETITNLLEAILPLEGIIQGRTSTLELLNDIKENLESPYSLYLDELPRILLIMAMRHPVGHKHLVECYHLLSANTMTDLEKFLPVTMLKTPSMLPFISEMRCGLLEKMTDQDYQLECEMSTRVAEETSANVNEAKRQLEEEIEKEKPNIKKLKTTCDNYEKMIQIEIDPGMRRYLTRKRDRGSLQVFEQELFELLEKQYERKTKQFDPSEPIAKSKNLILGIDETKGGTPENVLPQAEECLTPYIFGIVPKECWGSLAKMGIETDRDLRVIGLDEETQNIVEKYREQLAECIVDEKVRSDVLKMWRELHKETSEEEFLRKAKLIVEKMNKERNPFFPPRPQGMSALIPLCDEIRIGSWEDAVLWVVKASAHYIWQKYSSQHNLEQTWEKWEGKTLATCGVTEKEDLLNLSRLQSKKRKVHKNRK